VDLLWKISWRATGDTQETLQQMFQYQCHLMHILREQCGVTKNQPCGKGMIINQLCGWITADSFVYCRDLEVQIYTLSWQQIVYISVPNQRINVRRGTINMKTEIGAVPFSHDRISLLSADSRLFVLSPCRTVSDALQQTKHSS
jgi:hypothetical protein